MLEVDIGYDNLLPILDASSIDNQPFRCQGNVIAYINFDDYKRLVEVISELNVKWLSFESSIYAEMLQKRDDTLVKKYFYSDLCEVVLRELVIAMANDLPCTNYSPVFSGEMINITYDTLDSIGFDSDVIVKADNFVGRKYQEFLSDINMEYQAVPTEYAKWYKYANFLRRLAISKGITQVKLSV